MSSYKVEKVPSPLSTLGEGPHWDAKSRSLYYVDIYRSNEFSVHRYDATENKTYSATIEGESYVSFIIPLDGEAELFAVGIGRRVGVIQWNGKSAVAKILQITLEVDQTDELKNTAINDGKADPLGRLYFGTIRTGGALKELDDIFDNPNYDCALYRYDVQNNVVQVRDKVRLSNGLAWNEKENKFYYVDSCDLDVKEFDYNSDTGDISNERVVVSLKVNDKRPGYLADGMTIDRDGNLYVAAFAGSKVLKINPRTGKIELEINLPVKQVTSVIFGGDNLDELYVTTARFTKFSEVGDDDGHLFKVTGLGVTGLDGVKVRNLNV